MSSLTSPDNSTYIGAGTRGYAVGDDNVTVIGYQACGCGNNTVSIGNGSVSATYLNGNVSIGTTAPAEALTVSGNISANGGLSATGGFVYFEDNVGINAAVAADGAGLAPLVVRTKENNTEAIRIGNACGGSGSVKGKTLIGLHSWDTGTYPGTYIGAEEKDTADYCVDLFFSTRGAFSDSAPTERMRIKSTGNVGIGTAAPAYRLDVEQDSETYAARIFNDGDDQNRDVLLLAGGADDYLGNTKFITLAAGDGTELAWIQGADAGGDDAGGVAINTTGADGDDFVVTGSGKVGIGTAAPAADLTVSGSISSNGTLFFSGLPSSDPGVAGQIYEDYGTLKVSSG